MHPFTNKPGEACKELVTCLKTTQLFRTEGHGSTGTHMLNWHQGSMAEGDRLWAAEWAGQERQEGPH